MTKTSLKDKSKNGSSSLFAAYLANMNMPLSSMSKGAKFSNREKTYKANFDDILGKDITFPDNMATELLIRYIAVEHEWFEDQTKTDIAILIKNRLSTVKDLRTLSKESWKQIELLPITKDLLRETISRGKLSAEEEYLKKKERLEKRKERRLSRDTVASVTNSIVSINNTYNNTTGATKSRNHNTKDFKKELMDPASQLSPVKYSPSSKNETSNALEVTKHSTRSSLQLQLEQLPIPPERDINSDATNIKNSLTIDTFTKTTSMTIPVSELDNIKRFMPEPNKMLVGEDRLKIRTDNGKIYEIDRFCPHAGADLFSRGVIVGSKVICSKHYWTFSLEEDGNCISGGKGSINACAANDW